MTTIPVIDCKNNVAAHTSEIYSAIKTVGFVQLVNYGFHPDLVEQACDNFKKFWAWPQQEKDKYARSNSGGNSGYVAAGVEKLDPTSKFEIREAFNIVPGEAEVHFPTRATERVTFSLFIQCRQLGMTILEGLMDKLAKETGSGTMKFVEAHKGLQNTPIENNKSTIRMLHYPPVASDVYDGAVTSGHADRLLRCGEHTDYGSLTLLWQDEVGGLEVTNRAGEFVPAIPVEGAVLVNTGDLLQRFTDDEIVAVRHRVRVVGNNSCSIDRYSTAFFMHPDDGVPIQPFNGSNKYVPITNEEHLAERLGLTYK